MLGIPFRVDLLDSLKRVTVERSHVHDILHSACFPFSNDPDANVGFLHFPLYHVRHKSQVVVVAVLRIAH
jgi:hypothetical protein